MRTQKFYQDKKKKFMKDSLPLLKEQAERLLDLSYEGRRKKYHENFINNKKQPKEYKEWCQRVLEAEKPYKNKAYYYNKKYAQDSIRAGVDPETQDKIPIQYHGGRGNYASTHKRGPKNYTELHVDDKLDETFRTITNIKDAERRLKSKRNHCKADYKIGNIFKTLGF